MGDLYSPQTQTSDMVLRPTPTMVVGVTFAQRSMQKNKGSTTLNGVVDSSFLPPAGLADAQQFFPPWVAGSCTNLKPRSSWSF